ncbi:MAG: GTPase domain-containing protein, partial [Deltaproteobacteria bacterium]|nr:GTPase domain-containing protein [Deltaproteobacteria bacterium]
MAFINEQAKEINCKIVYFGPPLCGKSTTLRAIANQELVSISNDDGRTLFFDFVPLVLGKVKDFTIRLQLYT